MVNEGLPVAGFQGEILAKLAESSVLVITADTGAGKSTQVPQFLLGAGYNIVVTQPRRVAVRSVARRVAYEMGCELGGLVGYRTAVDRRDSAETRCLFATDGLALVRELMGAGRHNCLVLDEFHERNLNVEVLAAWSKLQLSLGATFKLVIMSATVNAEEISRFFGGAPIVSVPGRLHPIEEKPKCFDLVGDVESLLCAGRNVLVFQPGKAEIAKLVSDLEQKLGSAAVILPLHGELDAEEQDRVFARYDRPKCVVATNVAQTSITIDDIDAVVDSGVERRVELVNGVEGLYLRPISLADRSQRKGRAGRCKPGVYIDHCKADRCDRREYPVPEILRTRLDQTVLRLAETGFDAEQLEFLAQPPKSEIHEAKRALKALGCMDQDGRVTEIGHRVAKMPISVQFARMVVEAEKLGVVDDVLTIAAILEVGEITLRGDKPMKDHKTGQMRLPGNWKKLCPDECESDVMAQLAVYKAACAMKKEEFFDKGVFAKNYYRVKETRAHLADSLRGKVHEFRSSGEREAIIRAVCAGMVDHLFQNNCYRWVNGDRTERELGKESVVRSASWIVGLPFDLQITTRRGQMTLKLIRCATKVSPEMLAEVAPQLVATTTGVEAAYDSTKDVVTSLTRTFFNGAKVSEKRVDDPQHSDAADLFARWVAGRMF